MSIGQRISKWLNEDTFIGDIDRYFSRVVQRTREASEEISSLTGNGVFDILVLTVLAPFGFIPYVFMGLRIFPKGISLPDKSETIDSYSKDLANLIRQAVQRQSVREPIEILGTLVSEPVVAIFESYAERDEFDYQEFIRAFHGLVATITLSGSIPAVVGEIASLGQIELLGKPINDLYFNLGLGFLGWQTLAPILENGIGLPAGRDIARKFRQRRLSTGEGLGLYHQNQITYEHMVNILRNEGWREIDIPIIIRQSYNNFSDGQVFDFFEKGLLQETQVRAYLRANGWEQQDIDLIIQSRIQEQIKESKAVSLSTAKKALKLGTITEGEFREFLKSANYSDEAIQLEVNVIRFEDSINTKELTISQIKQAYTEAVITENEAIQGLLDLGYTQQNAALLFETWKRSKQPRVLRINQGTIIKAMGQGVLSESEALNRLQSIGYTLEDARLIIASVTVKSGIKRRLPSVSQLLQAMQAGIISEQEAQNRLQDLQYEPNDARLLIDLSKTQNVINTDERTILDAFLFGAITEDEARQKLAGLNASEEYINISLETQKRRRAGNRKSAPISEIAKWFRHGLIDETQALEKVELSGLSTEDSELFIQSVGLGTPRSLNDSSIRDSLFYGIITTNEALELLRKAGLDEAQAEIQLETMRAQINHKTPKAAISSLLDAARKEIITLEEFENKLAAYRLPEDDIETYLTLAVYEPVSDSLKLTKADILKAYKLDEIDRFTAITFLEVKGYSIEEAELLVRMERKEPSDTSYFQAFLSGDIDEATFRAILQSEGYTSVDIDNLLSEF